MKVTHWYRMAPAGVQPGELVPQIEEGITEVRWAYPDEGATMEPDAFGNIAQPWPLASQRLSSGPGNAGPRVGCTSAP